MRSIFSGAVGLLMSANAGVAGNCNFAEVIFNRLSMAFQEAPVGGGYLSDGSSVYVFDTPSGAVSASGVLSKDSFSIVKHYQSVASGKIKDVACIIASGTDFQPDEVGDFSTKANYGVGGGGLLGYGIADNGNLISISATSNENFQITYRSPRSDYVDSVGVIAKGTDFSWSPAAFK